MLPLDLSLKTQPSLVDTMSKFNSNCTNGSLESVLLVPLTISSQLISHHKVIDYINEVIADQFQDIQIILFHVSCP